MKAVGYPSASSRTSAAGPSRSFTGAAHRSPPASVTHPRPFGAERGKRPGCGSERRWKRKEEAFGKCTRAWLWTRALSWAGPRAWHRTGHPPGTAWRAERAGRARSPVLPRGRAGPGARGVERPRSEEPSLGSRAAARRGRERPAGVPPPSHPSDRRCRRGRGSDAQVHSLLQGPIPSPQF